MASTGPVTSMFPSSRCASRTLSRVLARLYDPEPHQKGGSESRRKADADPWRRLKVGLRSEGEVRGASPPTSRCPASDGFLLAGLHSFQAPWTAAAAAISNCVITDTASGFPQSARMWVRAHRLSTLTRIVPMMDLASARAFTRAMYLARRGTSGTAMQRTP